MPLQLGQAVSGLKFVSRCQILEMLQAFCSFFFDCHACFAKANNQWDIAAELPLDPMDWAFARVLTGGIKGVAMVSWKASESVVLHLFVLGLQFGSL